MIFSLVDVPVLDLGATQRVNDPDVPPLTVRRGVDSSPKAPIKCNSASKPSIRSKLKGKALDFTETVNIKKAWTDNIPSNRNVAVFDDGILGDNDKLMQTPDKKGLPVIYGSNVTMDSPDPFSKYHEGPGPKMDAIANHGGFDAECEMSTPVKSDSSIPLIYGSKVTMNSPDPFSKYHEGPGPKVDIPFMKDDLDIYSSTLKDLVAGRKVVLNGGDKSKGHIISPQGIADLDDMDMLASFGNSTHTPVKSAPADMTATINCRTGGFGHIATEKPSLPLPGQKAKGKDFIPDEKCTISDIRKQLGGTSAMASKPQVTAHQPAPIPHPKATSTTSLPTAIVVTQKKPVELSIEPRPQVRPVANSNVSASNATGANSSVGRKPLEPISIGGNQPLGTSQSTTSLQALKHIAQSSGSTSVPTLTGNSMLVDRVSGTMQENVRPSTGYHVNSTRQPHHTHNLVINEPGEQKVPAVAKIPLKPTPPPQPAPGIVSNGAPTGAFGRRNLMRDKDMESAHSEPNPSGTVIIQASSNQPAPRPSSVARRGRSYVESKDPAFVVQTSEQTKSVTSSFLITNSSRHPVASADSHSGSDIGKVPVSLEVVGDACIINKSQGFGPVEQAMMITGRPISARTTIISPVKAFDDGEHTINIPIEEERLQLFKDDVLTDSIDDLEFSESSLGSSISPSPTYLRESVVPHQHCQRKVQVTCVSSDPTAASRPQKKKRSSRRLPYQPLRHLSCVPEDEEIDFGIPTWLTIIGSGCRADSELQSLMTDMDNLFLGHDNAGHGKSKPAQLNSTLRRGQFKVPKVQSIAPTSVDRRNDTYGLWMSNQTVNSSSEQPSIFSAIRRNDLDLIKDNLDAGVWSLTSVDAVGNSPLIVAVFSGIGRIVRYLIKAGAPLDSQNRFGNTALHFSAELEFDKVTNYLVKKGASVALTNAMGYVYNQRM